MAPLPARSAPVGGDGREAPQATRATAPTSSLAAMRKAVGGAATAGCLRSATALSRSGGSAAAGSEGLYENQGKKQASILSFFARQPAAPGKQRLSNSAAAAGSSGGRPADKAAAAPPPAGKEADAERQAAETPQQQQRTQAKHQPTQAKQQQKVEQQQLLQNRELQQQNTTSGGGEDGQVAAAADVTLRRRSPRLKREPQSLTPAPQVEQQQQDQQQQPLANDEEEEEEAEESVRRFKRLRRDPRFLGEEEDDKPEPTAAAAASAAAAARSGKSSSSTKTLRKGKSAAAKKKSAAAAAAGKKYGNKDKSSNQNSHSGGSSGSSSSEEEEEESGMSAGVSDSSYSEAEEDSSSSEDEESEEASEEESEDEEEDEEEEEEEVKRSSRKRKARAAKGKDRRGQMKKPSSSCVGSSCREKDEEEREHTAEEDGEAAKRKEEVLAADLLSLSKRFAASPAVAAAETGGASAGSSTAATANPPSPQGAAEKGTAAASTAAAAPPPSPATTSATVFTTAAAFPSTSVSSAATVAVSCPSSSSTSSFASLQARVKSEPSAGLVSDEEVRRRLLGSPAARHSLYFRSYIEDYYRYCRRFSFPTWLQPRCMRDGCGRRALDCSPEYDVSTLWLPAPDSAAARQQARPHLTPGMRQYWDIKKQHFDKLVLFKIGKFYEFVYSDACAAHRVLDLNWMGGGGGGGAAAAGGGASGSSSSGGGGGGEKENDGDGGGGAAVVWHGTGGIEGAGSRGGGAATAALRLQQQQQLPKPHCGFPEQVLQQQARSLVAAGYKLVVVEQTETPKELEQRNISSSSNKEKAVRREVSEVITAGTIRHADMLGPSSQLLLSIFFGEEEEESEENDVREPKREEHSDTPSVSRRVTPSSTTAAAGGAAGEKAAGGDGDAAPEGQASLFEEDEGRDVEEALELCAALEEKHRQQMRDAAAASTSPPGGAGEGAEGSRRRMVLRQGFAACLVDVSTCRISLVRESDSAEGGWPALRLLLAKTLPAEVIYSPSNMPAEALRLLRSLPCPPQLSPLSAFPDLLHAQAELDRYVAPRLLLSPPSGSSSSRVAGAVNTTSSSNSSAGDSSSSGSSHPRGGSSGGVWDPSAALCMRLCERYASLQCAMGGVCMYLRSCRLDEAVLHGATFEEQQQACSEVLLFDVNALQQLEVLQTQEGETQHSLLGFLDRTVTHFGHRLLRRWVTAPLLQKRHIEARQQAVAWLHAHPAAAAEVRRVLCSCPDMERVSAKICAQSRQEKRGAVYFDQFHQKLLVEFLRLLSSFTAIEQLAADLYNTLTTSRQQRKRGLQQRRQAGEAAATAVAAETAAKEGSRVKTEEGKTLLSLEAGKLEEQNDDEEEEMPELLLRLCRSRDCISSSSGPGDVCSSSSSSDSDSLAAESQLPHQAAGGEFPRLAHLIAALKQKIATDADGSKIPAKGVLREYDESVEQVETTVRELHAQLDRLRTAWRTRNLNFVHSKFKYEVECPDSISKALLRDYHCETTSTRKGYIRFHTPEIASLVDTLEDLKQLQKDLFYPFFAVLFHEFYQSFHSHFSPAIRVAAELDCLQSLAHVVSTHPLGSSRLCRPEIVEPRDDEAPVLVLRNCRHPVAETLLEHFVPNDVVLNASSSSRGAAEQQQQKQQQQDGSTSSSTLLLTGPNMGGKSTLLRQTCLCVMLSQIGCFVPADACVLTPVDKIFTRLGAEDFILQGASTFLVEVRDVANLLRNGVSSVVYRLALVEAFKVSSQNTYEGTRYSLAVIDELGRGTSTFDGTAIALATVEYITDVLQCRCLFATHYHLLCWELQEHPHMTNMHMRAAVDAGEKSVSFLYKLAPGICPKSHGIHVARLAGIPPHVLLCAEEKAARLQQQVVRQQRRWRVLSVVERMAAAAAALRAAESSSSSPEDRSSSRRRLEDLYTSQRKVVLQLLAEDEAEGEVHAQGLRQSCRDNAEEADIPEASEGEKNNMQQQETRSAAEAAARDSEEAAAADTIYSHDRQTQWEDTQKGSPAANDGESTQEELPLPAA